MAERKVIVLTGADGNDYDVRDEAAQQSIENIGNEIGSVPSGKTLQGQIDTLSNGIGSVPSGQTVEGQISALESGKVPTTRKVNNKALSSDITLVGTDIPVSSSDSTKVDSALASKVPNTRKVNSKALSSDVNLVGSDIPVSALDSTKLDVAITDLKSAILQQFKWEKYNPLNVSLDNQFGATTYPNINYFFSQGSGGLSLKGKVKIHHYAKGNTNNKAILLRQTSSGYFVEKFFSWTESNAGYEEVETPFVLDGSGQQFVAIQGLFYTSGSHVFNQFYDNSTDEYITLPAQPTGTAILQYYLSVYEPTMECYDNPLRGKRWAILGDSRSVKEYYWTTKHYFESISERVGGILLENHAVAGAKIVNNIFMQPDNIKDAPHIITVYGGVNDYAQDDPTPLGTIDDATSQNTFYAKVKEMCVRLLNYFPSAHIVLITPQGQKDFVSGGQSWSDRNSVNSLGLTIRDYANAMINVAALYGIPVYDNCQHGGYTPSIDVMKNMYFTDGLHENATGNERLSVGLQTILESITKM